MTRHPTLGQAEMGQEAARTQVKGPICCVAWNKLLGLSGPLFPQLQNKEFDLVKLFISWKFWFPGPAAAFRAESMQRAEQRRQSHVPTV